MNPSGIYSIAATNVSYTRRILTRSAYHGGVKSPPFAQDSLAMLGIRG
jgi:hypothetical protein